MQAAVQDLGGLPFVNSMVVLRAVATRDEPGVTQARDCEPCPTASVAALQPARRTQLFQDVRHDLTMRHFVGPFSLSPQVCNKGTVTSSFALSRSL